jgi:hypothetical protein
VKRNSIEEAVGKRSKPCDLSPTLLVLLMCAVFSNDKSDRCKRDMARITGTESTMSCHVYTVDTRAPEGTNGRRHIAADLNTISDKTITHILTLPSGRKFEEITLDYCWCENAYYSERISASFFHKIAYFALDAVDTDWFYLFAMHCLFHCKTFESRVQLRRIFSSLEFVDMKSAGKIISMVKGHDSLSVYEIEKTGKGVNQLERIGASMASVITELSSTGDLSNRKDVHSFVSDILQGCQLESMKLFVLKCSLLVSHPIGLCSISKDCHAVLTAGTLPIALFSIFLNNSRPRHVQLGGLST